MRIIAIIGLALALLNIWAHLSEGKRFRGYGMCRDSLFLESVLIVILWPILVPITLVMMWKRYREDAGK
jgi:hypothetical protein